MRRVFALLLLSGVAHAQAFTNVLWPPRDVDVREDFGTLVVALDEDVLAVLDLREGQSPFVRTYVREGLNWIEDGRLPVQPATLGGLHELDVDGDRVLVSGSGGLEIFRRFGARDWRQRTVPLPASVAGNVQVGDLSGEWLAAASSDTVALLQRQQDEWVTVQEIPIGILYQIALDGDDLLVVSRFRLATIYRRSASTWTSEFRVGTESQCSLVNDRLALVLGGMFRTFDRGATGWSPSGTVPSDALAVRLTGDHAVLGLGAPYTVLRRVGGGWTSLGELVPPGPDARLGNDLAASGALVAVGSFTPLTENLRGAVWTFALDGAHATLIPSAMRMALEPGGTLRLDLDAGPASAGQLFVLAGSLSGSSPGFHVLGQRIPLNRRDDPYYPRSAQYGRLDADGRATVELVLPPTQPGEPLAFLKDRTFHHAFVVWDGRRITHVSNVALTAIVGRFH